MPEAPRADKASRRARGRRALLAVVALAWVATMARLVRSEGLGGGESEDVRALLASARRDRVHASARYEVRLGGRTVGWLESSVSGGQHDEQLAYSMSGRLDSPVEVVVRGVVIAGWDRTLQRLLLDVTLPGGRTGLVATTERGSGGVFVVSRRTPGSADAPVPLLVLPEAPVLAPGPLPLPELGGLARGDGSRQGVADDPLTGVETAWRVATAGEERVVIAGRARAARRLDVAYGTASATLLTEPDGFPLRLELPLGIEVVLVEESR
jgi:hypothetical protein